MPCHVSIQEQQAMGKLLMAEELDRVTRILCGVLRQLESDGAFDRLSYLDEEGERWWAAHQDVDKARARRQRLAIQAMKKLTTEERKALGLGNPQ